MPKTKFQNVVFTLMMSFLMVYAMICYNISMNIGGMTNQVFLMAFHEMIIMWPAAFILGADYPIPWCGSCGGWECS